ncbi:Nuclear pore complex subunit [Castilleja foliolosa]|uniref:demethylphylloquinone reductase n=1 Tax=Castilleja foliolosa TaxID=1961234 RepID=A0ABD3DFK0_9LAMI
MALAVSSLTSVSNSSGIRVSSGPDRGSFPTPLEEEEEPVLLVPARAEDTASFMLFLKVNLSILATFGLIERRRPRVCILGGGFGGLYTALRLESLDWPDGKKPQVVLVDQSEHFVFKPLLYELLSGEVDEWEIAPRFSDLLSSTTVQFLKDRVRSLHPSDHYTMDGAAVTNSAGVVHLESGLLIEYDWLVLALGAEAKLDVVPGAIEYAFPFSTLEDALRVNEKLKALERDFFGKDSPIRVAIVGCGYSGVELAATVSERLQDRGVVQAINVDKTILSNAPPGNRESAVKVLSSRNVQLLLGYVVRCIRKNVEDHNHERLVLELQPAERGIQSQEVEADLVLWTVGSKPLIPELGSSDKPVYLPLNGRGQAETDETLRVKGHPRIFAVGDSSAVRDRQGKLLPGTAQVAFQQADFAGWNLWAAINGRPLLPFRFQNLGEMMTLGRYDAAISPSFVEGLTLEGPIGHTGQENSLFNPTTNRRTPAKSRDKLANKDRFRVYCITAGYGHQGAFRTVERRWYSIMDSRYRLAQLPTAL